MPSRPRFSIRPGFAPVPTPLEAGRDRQQQGHHHGSDQATRGRDAQRDRQGGRPLRSSRRPRSRRHLWRRPEARADLGRLQGRQQAHLLGPLSDLDLRARGRRPQGARSAARLSARRRHRPAGPCRFSPARAGIAGAHRRAGARRQSRGLAGIEKGRRGQSRAPHGRGDGAGRRHSGIDHHRPHGPRFSRFRPCVRGQAAGGLPAGQLEGGPDGGDDRPADGDGRGNGGCACRGGRRGCNPGAAPAAPAAGAPAKADAAKGAAAPAKAAAAPAAAKPAAKK